MKDLEPDVRDLLLENMAGNYMIAQYQTSKLMTWFASQITQNGKPGRSGRLQLKSAHIFKHEGKWYRLAVTVQEVGVNELVDKD